MALDKNLFTLNLEPSKIEPNALDLVDPSETVHYRKRWLPNETASYTFSLLDPLSDSVLATVVAPGATSKEKVIELHNPSAVIPLTFKGTLTFKWCFVWEDHQFEWKREACYMIRKPDPPVLVAVTKEPAGRIKTSTVQILDYNLNRFDIEDRKGLEIVLLTSLLTFNDQSEQIRVKPSESSGGMPSNKTTPTPSAAPTPPVIPTPPPKPADWTGDQIAILQAKEQHDINEIVVGEVGDVDEYAKHGVSLLNDDTLLFITLRSHSAACVSKVVQVAEATKRMHYKSGAYDEDLHQYVDMAFEDTATHKGKGKAKGPPRIINLNDPPASGSKTYNPPNTLTIHLSKIAMPELEPQARKGDKAAPTHAKAASEPKTKLPKDGKSSSNESATLAKPRPASPPPQPNGLLAKLSAFTSRPSSPPPKVQSPPSPQPSPSPPANNPTSRPTLRPQPHSTPLPQSRPSHANGLQPPQHPQPPHLRHANSHPIAPHPSHAPPPQLRPHSTVLPPAGGPFPGAGPLNALPGRPAYPPPGNAVYTMYPAAFGAVTVPPQPGAQRASGTGFLDKLIRR